MMTTARSIALLCATSFGVQLANAAEHAALVTGPELPLPSIWRVMLVFVFAGAMAFTATLLLRKLKPWLINKGIAPASDMGVISHRKLARGLDAYVLNVEDQRFLIVHSSNSTVVSRLDCAADSPVPQSNTVTESV